MTQHTMVAVIGGSQAGLSMSYCLSASNIDLRNDRQIHRCYPTHRRGVTSMPGLYVLGLPWLYIWGSGRFVSVGRDAGFLANQIVEHLALAEA